MPISRLPTAYSAMRAFLDDFIERDEVAATITFQQRGRAINYRQQIYTIRRQARVLAGRVYKRDDPRSQITPYDSISIELVQSADGQGWKLHISKASSTGAFAIPDAEIEYHRPDGTSHTQQLSDLPPAPGIEEPGPKPRHQPKRQPFADLEPDAGPSISAEELFNE